MSNGYDEDEALALSSSTLLSLQEFYDDCRACEERFRQLEKEAEAATNNTSYGLSMDFFAENWQKSQFWYTDETTQILTTALIDKATQGEIVAILSAPSVYVMAKKLLKDSGRPRHLWPKVILLEFDKRFKLFKDEYVFYDYNNPVELPTELRGTVNHIISDPPFLSDDCQLKTATTVQWLSKYWDMSSDLRAKNSRLIICTGERMENVITELYKKIGVVRTNFKPEHSKQQLSNEFLCYANFECTEWLLIK